MTQFIHGFPVIDAPPADPVQAVIFDTLYRYLLNPQRAQSALCIKPDRPGITRGEALVLWRSIFGSRRTPGGRLLRTKRMRKKAGIR